MKSLINTLNFLLTHPLGRRNKLATLKRFFFYQFSKLFNPYPIVYPFTTRTRLIVEKGMTGATGNIYCGLHEFSDMGFLLHFLRKEDLFVDVGANIGSYTILASGHIGCNSITFEPVPPTFEQLSNNIAINHLEAIVEAHNIGLGDKRQRIRFTTDLDTVNHVMSEGEMTPSIEIQVETLDQLIEQRSPIMLKIDVEGYETQVLKGAEKLLHKTDVQAIIIELNGSGDRYGFNEKDIHERILHYGFLPYTYNPFNREFSAINTYGKFNTIYIRDLAKAQSRVRHAPSFQINGMEI